MQRESHLSHLEGRTTAVLSAIFGIRMLGLFIILPVFSLYTNHLIGATPFLIGLALGIYGLTQGTMQIPMGLWSDRVGRKPVILLGFSIFIMGSIIAALSHNIYGMVIGRALQGAGAVGSVLVALLADLTSAQTRTKAMAIMGGSIGCAFALAIVIAPSLNTWIGLNGIFWFTAILGIISLLAFLFFIPQSNAHQSNEKAPISLALKTCLADKNLLRLNLGIFGSHAILTCLFMALPILLTHDFALSQQKQWYFYLPLLFLSFIFVFPFIRWSERQQKISFSLKLAMCLLLLSQILLFFFHANLYYLFIILTFFFFAFTFLEAALPSYVSRVVSAKMRGAAMGIFSTHQFIGIFIGGLIGGWSYAQGGINAIFITTTFIALGCFFIMLGLKSTKNLYSAFPNEKAPL